MQSNESLGVLRLIFPSSRAGRRPVIGWKHLSGPWPLSDFYRELSSGCITDWKGSDTTWELRMGLYMHWTTTPNLPVMICLSQEGLHSPSVSSGTGGRVMLYKHLLFLSPPWQMSLCFASIGLSVRPQHYSQSYERIAMKFYRGVQGSRPTMKNWLNFGGDPDLLRWVDEWNMLKIGEFGKST